MSIPPDGRGVDFSKDFEQQVGFFCFFLGEKIVKIVTSKFSASEKV